MHIGMIKIETKAMTMTVASPPDMPHEQNEGIQFHSLFDLQKYLSTWVSFSFLRSGVDCI